MKAVLQTIRILVITSLIIENVRCQDGFSDQDLLRLQHLASNDGQIETITSYNTNIIQRDPSSQSVSSVSVQYHLTDDAQKTEDYNRADRGRSRKVYRIKNPFQRQLEQDDGQKDEVLQDSDSGASNQYAAMQYSLPPEEFLQQMRAENQYLQQQQQQQQQQQHQQQQQQYVSTPAPNLGYTVTPQPQYQYSTINPSNYENNHPNQVPQLEPKISHSQYQSSNNPFQYNNQNSYSYDGIQSTPSPLPSYVSTSLPNNQYVGTPANTYVSSSSPVFLSSQPNLQQYVSSPMAIQSSSLDYNNNRPTSTIGNPFSYENNDLNKKMQIDHYDNSANGIRYPNPQQYQNEYQTPTPSPSSSPYPDQVRDNWQNAVNTGVNSLTKSLQEVSLSQYNNSPYNNQQNGLPDNIENTNSDTHRIGNLASANNVYMNFAQPDYQALNNIRSRTRDIEQDTAQPGYYSHGDYGWKMGDKRQLSSHDNYPSGNFPRQQAMGLQPEQAVSQMTFHMDTGKPYNYDQISKSASDNYDSQEFAKAAAKAHEQLKQQQMYGFYQSAFSNNNQGNSYYNANDKKSSQSNPYGNNQQDLITASPFYNQNGRENNVESKLKQPFDHAKALKNIVPIDVSNVVPNSDNMKTPQHLDANSRYAVQNYNKDINEHNLKQYYKQITDAYYKDKNTGYGYNIKSSKSEDFTDELKQLDQNIPYYGKQPTQIPSYNHDNKRYIDGQTVINYASQVSNNYQDNLQSSANIPNVQRPQSQVPTDIASILKLNDIPYKLTQGLSPDVLRLHNNNYDQTNLPTPLPGRLNQNVGSHQIDVGSEILSKLIAKQSVYNQNRPDIDSQTGGLLSTINGFRVANPFNVDLKLVAEMLKGKSPGDDTHLLGLRDQFSKPAPIKLDMSQLQQLLLKNDNYGGLSAVSDNLNAYSNPYFDIYNTGRFPYQGVKYSRSQEEEESLPIADASNNYPIGAVIETDEEGHEGMSTIDLTAQSVDTSNSFTEERPKRPLTHITRGDRQRHPNTLLPGHHSSRKYPKGIDEPYPLLKPPPPSHSKGRGSHSKHGRRRRINKPKITRLLRTEPLFEAETSKEEVDTAMSTLLRPPASVIEAKSDDFSNDKEST
ncbi:myb-like protein P [Cydia pomonella]|uniref:myb-like protein P n=1 Tax=Cydia pomonella TaxID=82600 RepID=UPI002ADD9D5E|nr:myb-like protein P [Cydia pomonella]